MRPAKSTSCPLYPSGAAHHLTAAYGGAGASDGVWAIRTETGVVVGDAVEVSLVRETVMGVRGGVGRDGKGAERVRGAVRQRIEGMRGGVGASGRGSEGGGAGFGVELGLSCWSSFCACFKGVLLWFRTLFKLFFVIGCQELRLVCCLYCCGGARRVLALGLS